MSADIKRFIVTTSTNPDGSYPYSTVRVQQGDNQEYLVIPDENGGFAEHAHNSVVARNEALIAARDAGGSFGEVNRTLKRKAAAASAERRRRIMMEKANT
jgi:hypothetical protein